jgi:hypothetical protein
MNKKVMKLMCIVFLCVLLLTGCVPGDGTYIQSKPANFISGIWHGWIAPISLIMEIFNSDIKIYEPVNVGWLYDFGFYIAIVGGFGGIAFIRNKSNKNNRG